MMQEHTQQLVARLFERFPQVVVVYAFGSQVRGDTGPMSDYDFAVHLTPLSELERNGLKLQLMGALSSLLRTDAIDLVILNTLDKPELMFAIVHEGEVLFERNEGRLVVEPAALREYVDFRASLVRHGLTHAYAV